MGYSKKRNLISKILTKWGDSSPYFVYVFQNGGTRHYKIGITKDLLSRYTQAKTFVSGGLEIIKVFPCDFENQARYCEKVLHKYFKAQKTVKEDSRHEWYELTKADIQKLVSLDTKKDFINFIKSIDNQ